MAQLNVVYRDVAQLCLDERASERWLLDKVAEIASNELYSDEAIAPPLRQLFQLDDECGAGSGRAKAELSV